MVTVSKARVFAYSRVATFALLFEPARLLLVEFEEAHRWAHRPRARLPGRVSVMLGYLLGRRATKEQRVSVERKCATRTSAVKQCLAANPGDARACDAFGQDLDLCKGRVVCPDAAAAFSRCTHLVINHTGIKAETPDCSRALRELRRCLKGRGV